MFVNVPRMLGRERDGVICLLTQRGVGARASSIRRKPSGMVEF